MIIYLIESSFLAAAAATAIANWTTTIVLTWIMVIIFFSFAHLVGKISQFSFSFCLYLVLNPQFIHTDIQSIIQLNYRKLIRFSLSHSFNALTFPNENELKLFFHSPLLLLLLPTTYIHILLTPLLLSGIKLLMIILKSWNWQKNYFISFSILFHTL